MQPRVPRAVCGRCGEFLPHYCAAVVVIRRERFGRKTVTITGRQSPEPGEGGLMQPDTCEAVTGLYLGGAVDVETSLAGSWGCPEPATVTLRAGCVHEHVRQKRYCAAHGQEQPADGVWLCLPCAELGHDCPVRPEVVAGA